MKKLLALALVVSFNLKSEIYEIGITLLKKRILKLMFIGLKITLCLMEMRGLKLLIFGSIEVMRQ